MNLDEQPKVIGLANALQLDVVSPVQEIRDFCKRKVERFSRRAAGLTDIAELQRIVCERLKMKVVEVWSDHQLVELMEEYVEEPIFLTLPVQLSPDAFGVLIKLDRLALPGGPMFVAVIDCRGDKQFRRYWTIWHEIVHCLTSVQQYQLPLRRTTSEMRNKDPIERLTDLVAGDFAFYRPLFAPILAEEISKAGSLTFLVAQRVRERFNADASFASTVIACVGCADYPMIYLEAGLSYKKAERDRISAGAKGINASLRVLKSVPNEFARAKTVVIPLNYRVPESSVIARLHSRVFVGSAQTSTAVENLGDWTTSGGRALPRMKVIVEARIMAERVTALVTVAPYPAGEYLAGPMSYRVKTRGERFTDEVS